MTFATPSFAGGEGNRALRIALDDLTDYLNNEEVRIEANNHRGHEYGSIPFVENYDELSWLANELKSLQPIKAQIDSIFNAYQYGVIYAIRFDETDLDKMANRGGMGLIHFGPVSPNKIVGKFFIDFVENNSSYSMDDPQRFTNGIVWRQRLLKNNMVE